MKIIATLAGLFFSATVAFAAPTPPPVPFIDANNNSVFDAGDVDISKAILDGHVETTESVVLPKGMKPITSKSLLGINIKAGKNITISGKIKASAKNTGITLNGVDIALGEGADLNGALSVDIFASRDIFITAGAKVTAAHGKEGQVRILAENAIVIANSSIKGFGGLDFGTNVGSINVTGSKIKGKASVEFFAVEDANIVASQVKGAPVEIDALGTKINLSNSKFESPRKDGTLFAVVSGQASTLDRTGTVFKNYGEVDLVASTVIP